MQALPSVELAALEAAVQKAGFSAASKAVELNISGMTCASCVSRVEKSAEKCRWRSIRYGEFAMRKKACAGRPAGRLIAAPSKKPAMKRSRWRRQMIRRRRTKQAGATALKRDLIIALILAVPVFVLEMGSHMIPAFHHFILSTIGAQNSWYLQFALTTLILPPPGRRFFVHGVPALPRRRAGHEFSGGGGHILRLRFFMCCNLYAAGAAGRHCICVLEAAAVIIALILLGRYLEARLKAGRRRQFST